ncbi:MAG TPA: ABC transporter permease [Candidatus Limnocylindrales bacterium]|nr:ABC transporter permease [Candidatus Limnocylindrales bacterium]
MTTAVAGVRRGGRFIGSRLGRFWSGISAVSIKELRGRMRGRRAFVVLTVYLLLLALFAFAIYVYLKQQATLTTSTIGVNPGIPRDFPGFPLPNQQTLSNGTALSAAIGHGIFGGLLFLETLLVLVLAPAFTTGAISLEREKQTLDMLVTTPLSSLGMVIGKLFSALTYVFLLIIASIPLASLVFVFGGVGPEDLIRAYVFLFALAFGMGAVGLFISAIVKRTQTATVVTFVLVLVLSIGTAAAHQFWQMTSRPSTTSVILAQRPGKAPEAVLWFNPFVADLDMVCATAPDTYHASCEYISSVVNKPYFGTPTQTNPDFPIFEGDPVPMPAQPGVVNDKPGVDAPAMEAIAAPCPDGARCVDPGINAQAQQQVSFGFPRDTFWPKSAAAFTILGIALTLASAQLVSPTRRLRLRRPGWLRIPGRRNQIAVSTSVSHEPEVTVDEPVTVTEPPEKTND